jgi:hypothetical protein
MRPRPRYLAHLAFLRLAARAAAFLGALAVGGCRAPSTCPTTSMGKDGSAAGIHVLFDSMGNQIQVDDETSCQRLSDLFAAVEGLPAAVSKTDYTKPIAQQLAGIDVLVILTHQYSDAPGSQPAIPADFCIGTCSVPFQYPEADLDGIPMWVQQGGGLLLVTNHGGQAGAPDYWDVNDIPLAQRFGITIVPAFFVAGAGPTLTMTPASSAPPALVQNVTSVQALDSGGITGTSGEAVLAIPSNANDVSGLDAPPSMYNFAWSQAYGKGKVIVLGHAGIVGNDDTTFPSPGQFGAADNRTFLLNCIKYLGGAG